MIFKLTIELLIINKENFSYIKEILSLKSDKDSLIHK